MTISSKISGSDQLPDTPPLTSSASSRVEVNIIHQPTWEFLSEGQQWWEDSAMMLVSSKKKRERKEMTEVIYQEVLARNKLWNFWNLETLERCHSLYSSLPLNKTIFGVKVCPPNPKNYLKWWDSNILPKTCQISDLKGKYLYKE
jgi:hypothetical protein